MVVIADTSPLNYLILIGEVELLPGLYRRVLIPQAVIDELRHADAPALVCQFARAPPHWLEVVAVDNADLLAAGGKMPDLDGGEVAAITLAGMYPNPLLLMDEAAGRAEAARRGIPTTGTLGILRDAAADGLVDLGSAFAKLRATTFRLPLTVVADLLIRTRAGETLSRTLDSRHWKTSFVAGQ